MSVTRIHPVAVEHTEQDDGTHTYTLTVGGDPVGTVAAEEEVSLGEAMTNLIYYIAGGGE